MKNKDPFCVCLGGEIIVTVFNNEIDELNNYAEDVGHLFWYIMGTDAWFELQKTEEKTALICKSYEKTYFSCFINQETYESIEKHDEYGITVISSSVEFKPEDLIKKLSSNPTKDELFGWIEDKIQNHNMNLNALIFAYYTKERKKYYEDYFSNLRKNSYNDPL